MKGKVVIGQSGGPTAVINQSLVGLILKAREYEPEAIYGALFGVKGILDEDFVDLSCESTELLERVARTPSSGLRSVRKKPTADECGRIFEVFKAHDVRWFFYIGGNDTAETAEILSRTASGAGYELACFHVPKTIDNDLRVTDHCPGYPSAAKFVAHAFIGDNLDNRSLPGIKVNVVMGRHAGWLTAASILARKFPDDGPHLVYLPEVDFNLDSFAEDVSRAYGLYGRCVVAVSEGVHGPGGTPLIQSKERDSHGNVQLSGTGALGDLLATELKTRLGDKLRVRADTFGYLQRCFPGIVSEVDAVEARMVGSAGAEAALGDRAKEGSIAIRRLEGAAYASETFVTPLDTVARVTKDVPPDWLLGGSNVDEAKFLPYLRPIVGELPEVARLEGHSVRKMIAYGSSLTG
ncbi:MAG: 6-phosphofructokinase [Gemmatimonadetes bacterium]|nr:6-phosphofructokinase [Gemmatimonadota bacterium]